MQALIKELAKLVSGRSRAEQFRDACREYAAANPGRLKDVADWFKKAIAGGRVSAATWDLVADLFASPQQVSPPTVAGTNTVIREKPEFTEAGRAAPNQSTLQAGHVVLGRYTLVQKLGRGGMGEVFKAKDSNLEKVGSRNPFVALKVLGDVFSNDENAKSAIEGEALNAKRLSHENIIRVDDFNWYGGHLLIIMEYLNGTPLDQLIRTEYSKGLSFTDAWGIINGVGSALAYAHKKGVVHSDVKPGNVFITRKKIVKVLDFGISRPMAQSASNNETIYNGAVPIAALSPAYAALEQWTKEPPDQRDDIYAFALVIYELLTGNHPFARASAKEAHKCRLNAKRIDALSRKQWDGLRHALVFEREHRTKTVNELLAALEPPSIVRKYRKWVVVGAALLSVAAVIEVSQLYSDFVTQEMLNRRAPPATPPSEGITGADKTEAATLISLATDELGTVNKESSVEELAYRLSEGANNVNDTLDGALRYDPTNAQALTMKSRVADLYLQKAVELVKNGDYKSAQPLVVYGLKVMPTSLDLFKLQQRICAQQANLCIATPN
jgi:serine/threonine protein kinase